VKDFEEIAQHKLPPAHWGYLSTAVDDDRTTKANIAAFQRIELRPRRLVDVSHTDIRTELFGTVLDAPIFLCPASYQRIFHPDAELGSARAALAKNTLKILSTGTSVAYEEVAKARGAAPWYQFDMPLRWEDTEKVVRRVEDAGCPVLAMTVEGSADGMRKPSCAWRGQTPEIASAVTPPAARDELRCLPEASQ
jgi:4-hydroxymandelate oxidase